jgi:hypothetical protein
MWRNGGSWTRLKANLPTVAVHDLLIHPREGDLVLGTYGRGFWTGDITPLQQLTGFEQTVADVGEGVLMEFQLHHPAGHLVGVAGQVYQDIGQIGEGDHRHPVFEGCGCQRKGDGALLGEPELLQLEHGARDFETNVTDDDEITTGKIALAHLKEFPDYYTRLAQMEQQADEYWEKIREEYTSDKSKPAIVLLSYWKSIRA